MQEATEAKERELLPDVLTFQRGLNKKLDHFEERLNNHLFAFKDSWVIQAPSPMKDDPEKLLDKEEISSVDRIYRNIRQLNTRVEDLDRFIEAFGEVRRNYLGDK
jgi:hypothetical protein